MANKKIVAETENPIKDEKIKQNENVGYKGNVSIKILKKDGKVVRETNKHNTATVNFFRLIANAIGGDSNSTLLMPKYIHLYNWDPSTTRKFSNSTCMANIPFSRKEVHLNPNTSTDPEYDNSSADLIFEFMVPYTQLFGNTNILALYGTSGFNSGEYEEETYPVLAYVILNDEDAIDIENNDRLNVLVTWTINIRNQ